MNQSYYNDPHMHRQDERFFGPIGPLGAGLLGFGLGFLGGEIADGPPRPYPYPPYGPYPYYGPGPGPGPNPYPFGPRPPYGPGPFYGPY
ncbi:hypothetical protein F9U64_04415 [Gracilibacillus oryzae]|uniref:Spore coat protein n=2 Tax=Gracilibacillus oryzae TaxID=1672701 RepID=A0A7C8KRV3_9BACI|nr:hypothetical protein F9U64_04415 [Gracilibacillus oryzae]